MKKRGYLFIILIFILSNINSQVQRALIIGINQYEPPADYKSTKVNLREFSNLDGCLNDARSMNIVIQNYFGFKKENIDSLLDGAASREGIFNGLKKLLNNSNPGDIAFIYYSGHGSFVNNSFSMKVEKRDQTIVPSDSWKEGIHDIRDKELSAIFNAFLDKKVKLTTIFDCCNNGSISRGPSQSVAKTRFLESEDWDSMDSSRPAIPENRIEENFLIFSASRSHELAQEYTTENGIVQGAFTYSLIKAINQQPANASAQSIFQATTAILKNIGKPQQPIIGSRLNRAYQTLFGNEIGLQQSARSFPVLRVNTENNEVAVQAGFAMQISKNTELSMVENNKTVFTISVDTVLDLTHCSGKVIAGDIKNLQVGYLFNISKNGNLDSNALKIWIPVSNVTKKQLDQYLSELRLVKHSEKIKWMENYSEENVTAYTTLFYHDKNWYIKQRNKKATQMSVFNAKTILDSCKNKKDNSLYVELPVLGTFSKQLSDTLLSQSIADIQFVNTYDKAQYCLFGKMNQDGSPAYGFRKTNNMVFQDSLDPMPVETDCFPIKSNTREEQFIINTSLATILKSLSKINYWLNLAVPTDANRFMYHLEMYSYDSNRMITNQKYHLTDKISLKMVTDQKISAIPYSYHIYIFSIDGNGKFSCLFCDNSENSFPKGGDHYQDKEFIIFNPSNPTEPLGVDTYFLLASPIQIEDFQSIINNPVVKHTEANSKGGQFGKQYIQKISFQCLK